MNWKGCQKNCSWSTFINNTGMLIQTAWHYRCMEMTYLPVGTIHVEVMGCFYGCNVTSHLLSVKGWEVDNIISQISVPETLGVHNRDFFVVWHVSAGTGTDDNHTSKLFSIGQCLSVCDEVGPLWLSQTQESRTSKLIFNVKCLFFQKNDCEFFIECPTTSRSVCAEIWQQDIPSNMKNCLHWDLTARHSQRHEEVSVLRSDSRTFPETWRSVCAEIWQQDTPSNMKKCLCWDLTAGHAQQQAEVSPYLMWCYMDWHQNPVHIFTNIMSVGKPFNNMVTAGPLCCA